VELRVLKELWELMWILLFINGKLFSRINIAHHKILILLKGHSSQLTKEDPAYKGLCNSRLAGRYNLISYKDFFHT